MINFNIYELIFVSVILDVRNPNFLIVEETLHYTYLVFTNN